jgi:nucleotide-binding universal stress UspA family protein
MRTIIVPVNFSKNSTNAAHYAADLARTIGAELNLVHVFQAPMVISEVPTPEYVLEEMRDTNLSLLQNLAADLLRRTEHRIKVSYDLMVGAVEKKIESFCMDKKTFMVIMGASGTSLQNTLKGSTTIRTLVRHLPYPLLVIPENAVFQPVKNIVVACDREDIDVGIPTFLSTLREIAQLLGARLELLHVLTAGKELGAKTLEEYNIWKETAKTLAPELHFIRQSNVEEGVNEYLQNNGADWLMIFPKRHSVLEFHKSHSKQIVLTCPLPVMSIQE